MNNNKNVFKLPFFTSSNINVSYLLQRPTMIREIREELKIEWIKERETFYIKLTENINTLQEKIKDIDGQIEFLQNIVDELRNEIEQLKSTSLHDWQEIDIE